VQRFAIVVSLLIVCFLLPSTAAAQSAQPCSTGANATATFPGGGIGIELPPIDGAPVCAAGTREIVCDKNGGYLYTFSATNNTGADVTAVLVTPPFNSGYSVTPQQPQIPGGVIHNGQSAILQVTITGGLPGQKICFPVTLISKYRCCTIEICVTLPNCCAEFNQPKITCNKDGSYSYTFTVTNKTPNLVQHIYLYAPAGTTLTPSYFAVNLASGATSQPLTVTITGATPGRFCFGVSLHTEAMKTCCTFEQCIILPECGPPPVDISLAKHWTNGPVAGKGAYTLTVKNEGPAIAAGTTIKIADSVPPGVTLTGFAGTSAASWNCAPAFPVSGAATLTCAYTGTGTIASGAQLPNLILNATLGAAGSEIGIYENCASAALSNAAGPVTETNTVNNRDCAVTNAINPVDCKTSECPHPLAVCKQDVLLVVDASLSIGTGLPTVKNAIGKFFQAMQGKGGRVNIFSFNNQPHWTPITTGWTTVTSANAFTLANPIILSGTRTNWDDALERAYNVVLADTSNHPLVLFITDGDPNASNNPSGAEVDNNGMPVTAATEAVPWINAIRAAGSPLIAIGFGQVATAGYLDAAFTGNSSGPGSVSYETSSVIKMSNIADLPGVMATLGNQMCGMLSLNKRATSGPTFIHPIPAGGGNVPVNDTFSFAIDLTNNSTTAMSGIEVQDQVPTPVLTNVTVATPTNGTAPVNPPGNLIKWTGINLLGRQTATLTFSGKFVKTYTAPAFESFNNYAQVTAAPSTYTATTLGDMNPVTGPADDVDESVASFAEQVYQPAPDLCLSANKPAYCYLSVSKVQKNPGAEDGSCTSSAAGGAVQPCPFTISVTLIPTYIPTGSTVSISDTFTVAGGATVPLPWTATVSPSICPSATTVPYNCVHNSTTSFSGDVTVMTPAGQTGQKTNCVKVTILPLGISQQACAFY